MAADLNINVALSIVGSYKGADTLAATQRRLSEVFSNTFTLGSTITAKQSQIVAYYEFVVEPSSSISYDLQALAGADGKTYAFTSVKAFAVMWDDATANGNATVGGNFVVKTSGNAPVLSTDAATVMQIVPGGWLAFTAPYDAYLIGASQKTLTLKNLATSPVGGVAIRYLVLGMGVIT